MISMIVAGFEWVWQLLESAVERVELWFATRRWELAAEGLPACLVAVVLVFIILGQRSKPAVAVAEPYRQALHAALQAHDYERADLYVRKLQDLQAADNNSRYQFALLAAEKGKTEASLEQFWTLAPDGEEGYPPAHLWLAMRDLRRFTDWKADDRQRCLQHLGFAKADDRLRPRATELLAILFLLEHNYDAAEKELTSLSNPSLTGRVALAISAEQANQKESTRTAWSSVAEACETQLAATPDQPETRLVLAIAYSRIGQNDKAIQVLRDGLQLPAGAANRQLRNALEWATAQRLGSILPTFTDAAKRQRLLEMLLDSDANSSAAALQLLGS